MYEQKRRRTGIAGLDGGLLRKIAMAACLLLAPTVTWALPSYARQMHVPCTACHVGGFGPELTQFGRQFKLMGYTMKVGNEAKVPLSAMLVESFTHTKKAQTTAPNTNFGTNNNMELQQASIFLAGRLSDHMGMFAQATYSENGGLLGWDNADVRYAHTFSHDSHTGIWGISVNNNPSVSDIFNTAPAWIYPYMAPDLTPGTPAAPMLFGGIGGQSIGASAYAQLDGKWYVEVGAYRSLSVAFLHHVNAGYDGKLSGVAPYARLAYTWILPSGDFSLGGFLFNMKRGLVGADAIGNPVPVGGSSNQFNDLGVDSTYQYFHGHYALTLEGVYVDERQRLNASFAHDGSSNLYNRLRSFNLKGSYWLRNTYGVTLASFANNGSKDVVLYGNNGSPNTQGGMVEFDYNPFGQATSWKEPFVNVRLGLQYTFYSKFSGLVHNIDGAGRSASDNNTLYLYAWLAI